ncbi:hypothetical protein A1A1_16715 [Planococcus antarcticus DSM 14505]|uniref:Predicted DNA-binding protein ribbon-helix-helix domain-containing protein n=1 Tax=Planococcus antarcticus DSM 14505 TaxID=1185653 RepID=A0AA87LTD5_9BACL|nr:ribbon-helix-helix domain-containing protein [Planococcus antarcticus]EIM05325.1 hypothetical protein A1A1_16715 [Planococcus antarcticus DSM 14505]
MTESQKKKRVTFTINEALVKKLKEVSKRTMIPQSRLIERSLERVLEEYEDTGVDKE